MPYLQLKILHLKELLPKMVGEDKGDDVKRGGEDDDARYGEGGGGCHISP